MNLFRWIEQHTYLVHTTALILMTLASVEMYLAAEGGSLFGIYIGMAVFIFANLLVLAAQ